MNENACVKNAGNACHDSEGGVGGWLLLLPTSLLLLLLLLIGAISTTLRKGAYAGAEEGRE